MASQLRQVLNHFVAQKGALSVNALAQEMNLAPEILRGMLDYWVRKGKLRAVTATGTACNTCGVSGACPFVVAMPVYYEVVTDDDAPTDAPCACGGQCGV